MKRIRLPQTNAEELAYKIGRFIIEEATAFRNTGAVIGLSGGVDSTVTAALAKRAFDDYNTKGWKPQMELVGYILPSGTNKSSDTKDGIKVAERLGIRYEVHNIEPVVKAYKKTNPEAFDSKFDKGNLTSRIRANILNTKAATERKILLGTGNKDEDYGIGYYTLFGDGAVHISPIGCLSKRQVKDMARYLGFADIARKTPTAGLEPRQTDFNDLGYDYDIVELVMEGLEQGFSPEDLKNHQQLKKAFRRQMKKSKFDLLEHVVEDIIKRHEKCALPKAKLVSPKMPKIYMARV